MVGGAVKTCIAVFFLALSHVAAESQQPAPDLVLLNGKIFTSDTAHPYVQALAVRGERITATGDSAKIKALVGPHTKQIGISRRAHGNSGINDAQTTSESLLRITLTWSLPSSHPPGPK